MVARMLQNKTILITGGGTGIGLALGHQLAAKHNTVIIVGRREDKLKQACENEERLQYYVCDISDSDQCQSLHDAVKRDGHSLDILINNAAVMQFDDFTNPYLDIAAIENTFSTNVLGAIRLVSLFLSDLTSSKVGTVINVCSPGGLVPMQAMPVYSMTKAALDSYTRVLRLQAEGKFDVIEVFPPTVETDMTQRISLKRFKKMNSTLCAEKILKKWEAGKTEIWIGLNAHIFRFLNTVLHFKVFDIVNNRSGLKILD